jgi:hypothetical protein
MAEQQTGPVELGAPMDYREHEKTYNMFITGAKMGTGIIVSLMIAMAAGFFGHAGFLGGIVIFVVLTIASIIFGR